MNLAPKRISQMGRVVTGKTPSTSRNEFFGGEYLFVTPSDLEYDNYYCRTTERTVSEEAKSALPNQFIPAEAVMFTCIGATIGKCGIAPVECLTNQQINSIIANESTDAKFLYYLLTHNVALVKGLGGGAATPIVNKSKFEEVEFLVPPLREQQAISATLATYDDLIENNRRRMALLEDSARLLYREWFVSLRFPGHEHTPIADGIPEGWERKTLGDLADITMGQSPESQFYNDVGEGLPFHQGVADFGERFVKHRVYCTAHNRIADSGDILCSVRAPVGRLNITMDKIVIGRGLAALRSKSGNQSLLFQQLRAHFFKEDLIGTGAIFASVTKKEFEAQSILNPPPRLAVAFEEISSSIDEQLRCLTLQNQKLRAARDLLLPKLMNGEIAV